MTSSNDQGLKFEVVKNVCEKLVENGYEPEKISLRDIRRETSTGSFSTIQDHRERWLEEQRARRIEPVHITDNDMTALRGELEVLFGSKLADMQAAFETATIAMREAVVRLEGDLEATIEANEGFDKENEVLKAEICRLCAKVDQADRRAFELAAANADLRQGMGATGSTAQVVARAAELPKGTAAADDPATAAGMIAAQRPAGEPS